MSEEMGCPLILHWQATFVEGRPRTEALHPNRRSQ